MFGPQQLQTSVILTTIVAANSVNVRVVVDVIQRQDQVPTTTRQA